MKIWYILSRFCALVNIKWNGFKKMSNFRESTVQIWQKIQIKITPKFRFGVVSFLS